jgi:hypothetical protein
MRAVVDYLRHGIVYYHYGITGGQEITGGKTADIPETGTGSGEYGPINHMFPLTPIALHEGWIEGKERIVTALGSRTYLSVPPQPHLPPQVSCFDIHGRPIAVPVTIVPVQVNHVPAWQVGVQITDWTQIAVIEY